MKTLNLFAATLALGAIAIAPSFAQSSTNTTGSMSSNTTDNAVVLTGGMKGMQAYRARFIYNNLDAREVNRYRAMGFDDATIKGAANLALRTGIPIEYYLGRVRVGGVSLIQLAGMQNVPTSYLSDDLPGYGASTMMIAPSGTMPAPPPGGGIMAPPPPGGPGMTPPGGPGSPGRRVPRGRAGEPAPPPAPDAPTAPPAPVAPPQ